MTGEHAASGISPVSETGSSTSFEKAACHYVWSAINTHGNQPCCVELLSTEGGECIIACELVKKPLFLQRGNNG